MEIFCGLWLLLVGAWALGKGALFLGRVFRRWGRRPRPVKRPRIDPEAEERRLRAQLAAQRRREDARASCEIFFSLHAPEIGNRFTKAMFDDFVVRYLNDGRSPEEVERRAEQLRGILQQHLHKVEPPKRTMTIAELAQWFLREKQQIDAAPLSVIDKQDLLAALEERYAKLQEQHIRSMHP